MVRQYIAIDLKSFYASCECVERGLDPLKARLVVADTQRTDKTICLAVSPALKEALNIPGRLRLYEVKAKARAAGVDFEAAPPQMKKYMEISQKIYKIYAGFVATEDIHVYSIDEVFIDTTPYLKTYGISARELAERMIRKVLDETGITATAGIGTNLYLAKVAMDIQAKKMPADKHGVRIAELNEESYRRELWEHQPLTDFWRFGPGTVRRLRSLGIYSMGQLAKYSLEGHEKLYRTFGVNAELLIDHAWGREPVLMRDIKNYQAKNHSLSSGQVLHEPYDFEHARLITWEMADDLALELNEKGLLTDQVTLYIGFDKENPNYEGEKVRDFYGRIVPKPVHGSANLGRRTASSKIITEKILELYDKLCSPGFFVRRITISAEHVEQRENGENFTNKLYQADIFTDYEKIAQEDAKSQRLAKAEIAIRKKYGKNALVKLANFEEGATMRERNHQVGGHHE